MILEELLNDGTLVRRWSDKEVMLHKVGTEEYYAEAIDLVTSPYTYEETDQVIEKHELPEMPEEPTEIPEEPVE